MQGPAQQAFGDETTHGPGPHFLVKSLGPVAASLLGPVQGHVGFAQQVVGVAPGVGGAGDADAQGAHDFVGADRERGPRRLDDPLAQRHRLLLVLELFGQDHELVASQAGDRVRRAHMVREPGGHLRQDGVTGAMAERVVDHLEPVQVDVEHGQHSAPPGHAA